MPANVVEVILEMRRVGQFVRDADQASQATIRVGKEAETAGKRAQAGWKGLAKWAAGAGLVYGAARLIRSATSATEGLAMSTLALQRSANLDTQTASEWVGVLKERNISVRQFQVGLKTLSKAMEASRTGTVAETAQVAKLRKQIDLVAAAGGKNAPRELAKLSSAIATAQGAGEKSRKVLAQLGISMDAISKGNTREVLLQAADAISKMTNPAQRTAAATALLGRSGIALLPILMKGRKGIEEQLKIQERYGNYISGKGKNAAKTLIEQQRELHAALSGLQVQLGQALLPALTGVAGMLTSLARIMAPLTKNATLFKIAVAALATAFVAYKLAMTAAVIAQTLFNTTLGITEILLGGGILLAIIAVGAGFVLLYKKVGWFRDAIRWTWKWIAEHWPLLVAILLGPVGVATLWIIRHFDQIKRIAKDVWDWIKQNWPYLAGALIGPFGLAAAWIYKHFDQVKSAGQAVLDWFKKNWPYLLGIISGPFGLAAGFIIKHFDQVKRAALAVVRAVKHAIQQLLAWVRSLPGKVGHELGRIPGVKQAIGAGKAVGSAVGGAAGAVGDIFKQSGGYVGHGGRYIVGERGPEIVTLPAGATVTAHGALAAMPPTSAWAGRPLEITVPVYLDAREIARSTARVAADQLARR